MIEHKKQYINWRATQLSCRIKEYLRIIKQRYDTHQIALSGAFHETNLGDIALRKPFERILIENNQKYAIQNLYRFDKYKTCEKIIVTGGATGVENNIESLFSRYKNSPENVAMCGMDFAGIANFKSEHIDFLKSCTYISLRSKDQYEQFKKLGFLNTSFSYDNAFALSIPATKGKKRKVIGFNMLNLFMSWNGNAFEPGSPLLNTYKQSNPNAEYEVKNIGPLYIKLFNSLVDMWSKQGYKIEHVPFTPEDDFFAGSFISNNSVKFLKYTRNSEKVIKRISTYHKFYSTRFHATIFGFLSGTPTVPFIYSLKVRDLMNDLNINSNELVWRNDIVYNFEDNEQKFLTHKGIVITDSELTKVRESAKQAINTSLEKLSLSI